MEHHWHELGCTVGTLGWLAKNIRILMNIQSMGLCCLHHSPILLGFALLIYIYMISYGICLENISERTSAIENLCSTQSFGPFPTSLTIFVLVYLTCWLIILLPGLLNLFPTLEFPLPELANGFRVRESVMGLRCWCPIMVHMPRHHRHLRRRGIIPIYAL